MIGYHYNIFERLILKSPCTKSSKYNVLSKNSVNKINHYYKKKTIDHRTIVRYYIDKTIARWELRRLCKKCE